MVKLGSTGDKKPLELDDTVLESAETIANVLDLLLTSKDILILSNPRSVAIICFMKKYSMERELDRIGLQLREAIVNRKKAFSIWLLATVAEMFEIAGSVIESLGYRSWTDELSEDRRELYGECIPKGHVFDTRTWSVINYRLVPPEASWALGRASYKIGKPAGKFEPADYEAMGEEFTRLMKLPSEYKSYKIAAQVTDPAGL